MSQARCVFTLGGEAETRRNAGYLAQAFYPNEKANVRDLSDDLCFDGVNPSDLSKIIMLGHGSTSSYGGLSAADFAKLFVKRFRENYPETAMSKVRDLYLIGCDVGLINSDDGGSMAQEIANSLDKSGFHQVVVHCVAKPEYAKGDVLYVEVLNCSGASGFLALTTAYAHGGGSPDVQTGYIKAYLLSQADADKITALEKSKHGSYVEIANIKREHSLLLVNHAHPESELNKPHNIFYPRETANNRKLRVARECAREFSAIHAEAIALLVHRSEHLKQKSIVKEAMMAKKIDFLITQMRLVEDAHWHFLVNEYARYLRNHIIYGSFFNDDSKTTHLLAALAKKDMKAANKIIDEQEGKRQQRTMMQRLGVKKHESKVLPAAEAEPVMPSDLLIKIRQHAIDLDNEIKALRTNMLGCFLHAKIKTKVAKLEVVKSLQDCNNLINAKQIARSALSDAKVTAGMMRSRTSDLLHEIEQYQPDALASLGLVMRF